MGETDAHELCRIECGDDALAYDELLVLVCSTLETSGVIPDATLTMHNYRLRDTNDQQPRAVHAGDTVHLHSRKGDDDNMHGPTLVFNDVQLDMPADLSPRSIRAWACAILNLPDANYEVRHNAESTHYELVAIATDAVTVQLSGSHRQTRLRFVQPPTRREALRQACGWLGVNPKNCIIDGDDLIAPGTTIQLITNASTPSCSIWVHYTRDNGTTLSFDVPCTAAGLSDDELRSAVAAKLGAPVESVVFVGHAGGARWSDGDVASAMIV